MVIIHVSMQAAERDSAGLEKALRGVVIDARNLPGCLRYEWYRVPDLQRNYVAYGEFGSRESFESYLQSAVVKRIGNELMPFLAGPPSFAHYDATVLRNG